MILLNQYQSTADKKIRVVLEVLMAYNIASLLHFYVLCNVGSYLCMMAHHGGLLNFETSIISPFGFCDKKCQVPNQLIFVCEGY